MKTSAHILIYFFILSATLVFGQSEGIAFIDNELDQALELAAEKDKIIFVDAYTTWCGPCKMMDKSVFADPTVGEFFNENFVNLKLDMEKGAGTAFRQKYGVRGFPSFLFLNAAGVVVHRGLGFQPSEQFMKLAEAALDPNKQTASLGKQYEEGNREPEFLYNYADALASSGDPKSQEIAKAYLDTQESWVNPKKNMNMVAQLMREYKDPYFNYMVEKRHLFISEFGTDRVDAALSRMVNGHLYQNIEDLDLDKAKEVYHEVFPTNKANSSFRLFEINYHRQRKDDRKYIAAAQEYVKESPNLSSSSLNDLAWGFYEDVDDAKALKKAVKWAKKSISKDANSFNTDTLAALYYKLGKKKPALRWANKAIALAKASGQDFEETSKLIEKINGM